jgi:hypothetical protein
MRAFAGSFCYSSKQLSDSRRIDIGFTLTIHPKNQAAIAECCSCGTSNS